MGARARKSARRAANRTVPPLFEREPPQRTQCRALSAAKAKPLNRPHQGAPCLRAAARRSPSHAARRDKSPGDRALARSRSGCVADGRVPMIGRRFNYIASASAASASSARRRGPPALFWFRAVGGLPPISASAASVRISTMLGTLIIWVSRYRLRAMLAAGCPAQAGPSTPAQLRSRPRLLPHRVRRPSPDKACPVWQAHPRQASHCPRHRAQAWSIRRPRTPRFPAISRKTSLTVRRRSAEVNISSPSINTIPPPLAAVSLRKSLAVPGTSRR